MKDKLIAITGAGGFIGSALTDFFLAHHCNVIGMARTTLRKNHSNFSFLPYNLCHAIPYDGIQQADIVIHCAFMPWSEHHPDSDEINIKATLNLAEFCQKNNKQFVFLSSFSAHENANSHYGRHKFILENNLKDEHLVIKPGLVTGERGLFSRLDQLVQHKKIIPIIGDGQQPLQWISVEELCQAISSALSKKLTGIFPVASEHSLTYLQLLERLAEKKKHAPIFVFIPVFIAALLLKTIGKKLPFTEENLKGLLQLRKFETAPSLKILDITIQDI